MIRLAILFVIAGVMSTLTASVALAATWHGGTGDDALWGTDDRDVFDGGAGDDRSFGYDGRDLLRSGADDDFINDGNDGKKNHINCGTEIDDVRADFIDVLKNCEYVTRR